MDEIERKTGRDGLMENHLFEEGAREARLQAVEARLREHETRNERRFEKLADEIDTLKKICYILLGTVALAQAPQIISVAKMVL